MTEHYFSGCTTTAQAKDLYRKLARQHHPDLGGDPEVMKAINAEYDVVCARLQRTDRPGKTDKHYAYYAEYDGAVRQALEQIVTLPNIEIEVCGWWIWITGDTKPSKDALKAAKFRWSFKKEAWYFAGCPSKGRGASSLNDIRTTYGSERIANHRRASLDE